jgi:heme-degrading monooxygenase HmoA
MAFISITRLRVRSVRYLPQFLWLTFLSHRQAKRSSGCLAVKILRDAGNAYWTSTAWADEAAMRAYISSGAHRRVMPKLKDWCDEAYVTHWEQESAVLPGWQEAHRRMTENGRRSKVNNPSQAHLAFEIPEPKA